MTQKQFKKIEQAKETLKAVGYFVDNLWHIEDVKINYDCTDEQAQDILLDTLTNEAVMERIWQSIEITAEYHEVKLKQDFAE